MSRNKSGSQAVAAAVTAPSFLVYPVPSIADESFLQLIFRNKVKRSLFFGFGRGRMAIAELTSADVAHTVADILKKGAAVTTTTTTTVVAPAAATKRGAKSASKPSAADVDSMTLADMFAPPPTASQDSADGSAEAAMTTPATTAEASNDFSHLPYLAFRGRPVHVVVSGVDVSAFYESGGAVPAKHESKEDRSSSKKKARKGGADTVGEKRPRDNAAAAAAAADGGPAESEPQRSSTKTSAFPKNACQKCGSVEHFTRHCDGSGAATAVAAEKEKEKVSAEGNKISDHNETDGHVGGTTHIAATPQHTFPKDCCQKCGSPNHFTRHCDGSGVATSTTPAPVAAPAAPVVQKEKSAAPQSTSPAKKVKVEVADEAAERVVEPAKPKPAVIQRTSKDQCKFCGSDAHLSRHCPNK